jgi:hypothetical protein
MDLRVIGWEGVGKAGSSKQYVTVRSIPPRKHIASPLQKSVCRENRTEHIKTLCGRNARYSRQMVRIVTTVPYRVN